MGGRTMSENYRKDYCHICKSITMHEDNICMCKHAVCPHCEEEFPIEKQMLFNYCPFCGEEYTE